MVESAPVSTLPPTLPARPPTPPRESSNTRTQTNFLGRFASSSSIRRSSAPNPSAFTPDSSAESPNTSGLSRKKVGFSDWPQYNEPPTVSFDGKGVLTHAVQPLPPSAERKPSKSILKAHNANQELESPSIDGTSALLPLHHYDTFAKMLESIVQQLTGKDRSSKIDAYLMLTGSLKASDNVPDAKALKDRMGLLCQYIERDLTAKLENERPDSSLIVHALTLLGCFLHKPTIAESFSTDFTVHLVDHAIRVFEEGSMSKEVTRHLMFILAQQKFSSKVMNQERVGKLIVALHSIEERTKGKSIVQSRLQIYRTLLRQSRGHMITHTAWIEDLLSDMLSSLKDIRTTAITFGLEAGFSLGTESNVSRTVQNIFKGEHPAGEKFADYYIDRLKTWIKEKAESPAVPQIWSVVILFLRSSSKLLEQWQFFPAFLVVLSACFNIADNQTRTEAHYAWNRFIYTVRPSEKTSPKFKTVLLQPLSTQLKRKSSTGRKRTFGSIYTLLYYTLSPRSTPAELDMYWDEYLAPVIEECLAPSRKENLVSEMSKQDAVDACRILQALFDTKTPRKWTETRVMDNLMQNGMDVTELPALDSKWLRKNHARVFSLLTSLLQKLYWDLGDDSAIKRLWQSYITSIASPAVMEVKVSIDTMSCIASLFSLLVKLWGAGPEGLGSLCSSAASNKHVAFWKGFETILTITIEGLGIQAFSEKNLSIKHNDFIAVATPSQLPTKLRLETKSPLFHLIYVLSNPSSVLAFDHGFPQMIHSVLRPFFDKKPSKQARLAFIRELTSLLPTEGTPSAKSLWQVFADLAVLATDTREKNESGISRETPLGTDYRNVVSILEAGIQFSPHRPLPRWKPLFEALVVSATLDAGDAGKAIVVLEPLAKSLKAKASSPENFGLFYLSILLGKATYPKDRQALDGAERKLWGSVQSNTRKFDPFNELYIYTLSTLESAYSTFSKIHILEYADIMSSLSSLLGRCPTQLLDVVLAKLQPGITLWIADLDSKLSGGNALGTAIISLWGQICKLIPRLCQHYTHTKTLRELEVLICAGLESKHKTIVNSTIGMWNSTFGSCEDGLEYPQKAKDALLRLQTVVELQLPHFPKSLETSLSAHHRQQVNLAFQPDESSHYSGFSSMDSAVNKFLGPRTLQNLRSRESTPQVIIPVHRSFSLKRSREETPEGSRRKSKKRDVTPRMRHDDSQIQFEAIPSSSPAVDRVMDPQLLTEKQKEVRERQQADAAMFPDLRSSPKPRGKLPESEDADVELPRHRSSSVSSKLREKISQAERETTPIVIIPSDDDNGYVQSSPTPTRSLRGLPDDPPSSPPESAVKRKIPVVHQQISPSPPEGSPEPEIADFVSAPAAVEVAKELETDQDIPSPHESTPEQENDDVLMETTEINIDEGDAVPSADIALGTGKNTTLSIDPSADLPQQTMNDTTTSMAPSAQVDPDARQIKPELSTYDLSTFERSSSPAEDPSDQLRASQIEHEAAMASKAAEAGAGQVLYPSSIVESTPASVPSSIAALEIVPVYKPETPGTPVRHGPETEDQYTPKTPQFLDALSSPQGSDGHDVFEDAVSSPKLNIPRLRKDQHASSSPLSDLDESSMLRVMAEYDQASSGRISFLDDKENQPRRTRPSSSKSNSEMSSPSASASAPVRKSALRKQSGLRQSSPAANEIPEAAQLQTSSVPSLIPETPAPKPADPFKPIDINKAADSIEPMDQPVMRYYDDDGVEINMDETIIVDTSALEREGWFRAVKHGPRKKGIKRKHSEVPDNQEGNAQEAPSTPTRKSASPAKKKSRGRPKRIQPSRGSLTPNRGSQISVGFGNSQEISASQSFTSVDFDTSMAETDDGVDSTEASIIKERSALEEDMTEENMEGAPRVEEIKATADEPEEQRPSDENHMDTSAIEEDIVMDTILPDRMSSPDVDVIAETTFGDSSSSREPSSELNNPEVEVLGAIVPAGVGEAVMYEADVKEPVFDDKAPLEEVDSKAQITSVKANDRPVAMQEAHGVERIRNVEIGGELEDDVQDQSEKRDGTAVPALEPPTPMVAVAEEKPAVTMQSMKDKLQSLITDLRSASLSRREVGELEDMFMDAKRTLYDAESRGRQSADM
ncbi:uncharacterized protein PAC_16343 [Phialocephala subalpina]|uniref:Telomere-associated protein Rif1 N-terminal domain-containing protein n=1 Tax=Phialocephala subalpina TaxID=576137 RepID=A0A1L7XN29_9HELO|nr:uncharacterized protein PAC_16343 [Phialocephala subalpina]